MTKITTAVCRGDKSFSAQTIEAPVPTPGQGSMHGAVLAVDGGWMGR